MKKKNAISLIVLVITIIVMAILAATVIITLSNTNIISQANDAVKKTEAQQVEEMKALMLADGMLGKNPESQTIGSTTLEWDSVKKEVIEKRNGQLVKEGVIIPTDFYYVGGTKDTGLVISDDSTDENKGVDYTCVGNQFVWIPVDDFSKFVRGEAEETSTGSGIYKMTGALESRYAEPYTDGYATEVEEYNAMMQSVQKYGGFYIARFEAGDGDATAARTAPTVAHKVVSKKESYIYNYVPWGAAMNDTSATTIDGVANVSGAIELSKNMYKGSTSVVSTLCYGVQWDAALNYVSDKDHDIVNSGPWGNHLITDGSADSVLYTSGKNEAWKAKNIYDLAGNVQEWTMEKTAWDDETHIRRMTRGGSYDIPYYAENPSVRFGNTVSILTDNGVLCAISQIGFRVALYIK